MDKLENEQERIAMSSQASMKESCIPYFDGLWFCYTPGYQLRQYYRYGTISNCSEFWGPFLDCMKKRTAYAHQVEEKGPVQHPLWTLRTKEEAQQFWEDEFGHLKTRNGASSAGQQNQKEKKQEQRVRSFVASGDSQPQAEAAGAATAVSGTAPTPDQARLRPSTSAPD